MTITYKTKLKGKKNASSFIPVDIIIIKVKNRLLRPEVNNICFPVGQIKTFKAIQGLHIKLVNKLSLRQIVFFFFFRLFICYKQQLKKSCRQS